MIPDEQDFILNIANQTALDFMKRLKSAADYFIDDPEGARKCMTLHHVVMVHLLSDYIQVVMQMTGQNITQVFETILEDTETTINTLRSKDGPN